ncbi:integrase [Streptomyces sp. NBC_01456]|uniref:integrase n=1 Tax=unclassified Streptomyces TaxID=2593676 RepID=UPI002E350E30|nr:MULTISPECIES: integrase [unclassified Streptomyces]
MPYVEWRGSKCRVRWDTGKVHPETGKKIYDSKSGFADEAVAYEYGLDRESDVRNDRYISNADGNILFEGWAKSWLAGLDLADTSYVTYESIIKAQLIPQWGDVSLRKITTTQYQRWAKMTRARYSAHYAGSILSLFGLLMTDAVDHRPPLIAETPVPRTSRRRGRYTRPEEPEVLTPTTEQVVQLAVNAHEVWGLTGYVFMLTKAFTGMRLREMYGLRREFASPTWPGSDPDVRRRTKALKRYGGMSALRVQWQHQYAKGVPTLQLPKYGSARALVLPPFLHALHGQLLESHESDWVFPSAGGGHLLGTRFYPCYWRPAVDGAEERGGRWARGAVPAVEGLQGMVPHGLRHAQKQWLDEDGHSRVASEERLGHRLQGVEGTYSEVTVPMELRIVEALQERWEKVMGDESSVEAARQVLRKRQVSQPSPT